MNDEHFRSIWQTEDGSVQAIDQRRLPFEFEVVTLTSSADVCAAIADMTVRGAGLIGAAAAYGMYLGAVEARGLGQPMHHLQRVADQLVATRPTAVNLTWAVQRMHAALAAASPGADLPAVAAAEAARIADADVAACRLIGEHGLPLLTEAFERSGRPVNVLTHCNAGWLAFVDVGTATAPIYAAHDAGLPVHVWVDETRPRNQGARLTAWELGQHGVPHTVVTDNAGGHLMQQGLVDMVIVGTDRTTGSGDVANKIGTYLKALAAADNDVPFYVAAPSSSIDWSLASGAGVTIEERDALEVTHVQGRADDGVTEVQVAPTGSAAANFGFDVTPARLVTALITERGRCAASAAGLRGLFPDLAPPA